MAKTSVAAQLLAAFLIALFILDCFPVISASSPLGGKSRKLRSDYGERFTYFKEPSSAAVSLRQAAPAPPPPRYSQSPPRK
ncbi:UNVERIFIED_CONTAM: hypothetical protein Sindi_1545200 [Sesamum indicum]